MSTSTLPSSRAFVTQLLNSLPLLQQDDTSAESNLLDDAPEAVKKQLLALQVLFPNEFLPALDLLDRKLITRFLVGIAEPSSTIDEITKANDDVTSPAPDVTMQDSEPFDTSTKPCSHEKLSTMAQVPRLPPGTNTVHYVRSAQQRSSRFNTSYDSTITYEVRLAAWNCTCPAFAFAAFPSVHPEPPLPIFTPKATSCATHNLRDEYVDAKDREAADWIFGGMSLGHDMPPVCKHLLACVLVERCSGVFGKCVEERRVSVEAAAGWAAGWGDS